MFNKICLNPMCENQNLKLKWIDFWSFAFREMEQNALTTTSSSSPYFLLPSQKCKKITTQERQKEREREKAFSSLEKLCWLVRKYTKPQSQTLPQPLRKSSLVEWQLVNCLEIHLSIITKPTSRQKGSIYLVM